jgi:hypothetical protein
MDLGELRNEAWGADLLRNWLKKLSLDSNICFLNGLLDCNSTECIYCTFLARSAFLKAVTIPIENENVCRLVSLPWHRRNRGRKCLCGEATQPCHMHQKRQRPGMHQGGSQMEGCNRALYFPLCVFVCVLVCVVVRVFRRFYFESCKVRRLQIAQLLHLLQPPSQ